MTFEDLKRKTIDAAHFALLIYGGASAVISQAGLWEGASTWEGVAIAAVGTVGYAMTKWVERQTTPPTKS